MPKTKFQLNLSVKQKEIFATLAPVTKQRDKESVKKRLRKKFGDPTLNLDEILNKAATLLENTQKQKARHLSILFAEGYRKSITKAEGKQWAARDRWKAKKFAIQAATEIKVVAAEIEETPEQAALRLKGEEQVSVQTMALD